MQNSNLNLKSLTQATAFLGITMTILSGCSTKKDSDSHVLRIHLPKVNLTLDPQKMEDAYSMSVIGQIHRGLFRYDMTGAVLKDLAESWSETPDHREYRIKLKPAQFSDGTPIHAIHVQMTYARLFRLGAAMAADLDFIEGADQFRKNLKLESFGVKVVSENTVLFRLSRPSAIFLKQLAVTDCGVLKLTDFKQDPDLSSTGGFSGPYRIASPLQNDSLTIEKWRPDAMDSAYPPKHINYFMTEKTPMELAKTASTDSLDHDPIEAEDKVTLLAQGWAPAPTEISGELFVLLNPGSIPEEARRLMYATINQLDLMAAVSKNFYRPAYGLIPFGLPGELSLVDVQTLVPRNLLPLKKPQAVQLDFEENSKLEKHIADFLKSSWEKFNIQTTLNPVSKSEKLKSLFEKGSQAIIGRKTMDYPDGFSVLGYFKGNYDSNYFFINDPAIDRSLREVLQIFETSTREAKYREIQIQVLKKWTLIPLVFGSEASGLWSRRVKAVPAHPFGYHMLPMESVEMVR